jgi:DNA-binding transcriptional LysR family regulator
MTLLHWEMSVLCRAVGFPNLTAAADNIGISQPQLSRIVAKLEAELEVSLLDRSSRRKSGWAPTAHELASTYARASESLEKQIRALSGETRPDIVRVGALEGLADLAASFCQSLQKRCEVRTVELNVHDVQPLEDHFLKGRYDLIFVSRMPGRKKPRFERLLGFQVLEPAGKSGGPLVLSSFERVSGKDVRGQDIDTRGAGQFLVSNSLAVRRHWLKTGAGRGLLPSRMTARGGSHDAAVRLIGAEGLPAKLWKSIVSLPIVPSGAGLLAIALIFLPPVLSGCGKGLEGTYVRCLPQVGVSKRTAYTFTGSKDVLLKVDAYTTIDCTGDVTTQVDTQGTIAEADTNAKDANGIDLVYTIGSLKGQTTYQIYKLEGNRLYWGDTGGANDSSTSDRRPTEFDPNPYVKN